MSVFSKIYKKKELKFTIKFTILGNNYMLYLIVKDKETLVKA